MLGRRQFINAVAASGVIATLLSAGNVAAQTGDAYQTNHGTLTIYPVSHGSFVMETPSGAIYVDPVGTPEQFAALPPPALVLITHEHGDRYNAETLLALIGERETRIIVTPTVYRRMPAELRVRATAMANGQSALFGAITIDAIPAYNLSEARQRYHPMGRGNGYVLNVDGVKVYIAGDTEDTPEMRALTGIGIAFLPVDPLYTMSLAQAADAIAEFMPAIVYPYAYRDADHPDADPRPLAVLVAERGVRTQVKFGAWYP